MSLFPLGLLSQGGGAGGGGAFEQISTSILGASTSTITFSSIPSTYKHLQLRVVGRIDTSGASTVMRFNGDAGANYALHFLYGLGGTIASGASTSGTSIGANLTDTNSAANSFGAMVIDILDYSSTNKNKTTRNFDGFTNSTPGLFIYSGLWMNTAAITSLSFASFSGNFVAGSRFTLYGIKG